MATAQTEVVVIGSGFGGSVVAARLQEGGAKVTLLERGPWWDSVPTRSMGIAQRTAFPRGAALFTRALRSLTHPLLPWGKTEINRRGLFEVYIAKGMEVVCTAGVGGGSHVYSGLHRRPARHDFWDNHVDDLSEASMAAHYDAFLTRVGSSRPTPANQPPHGAAAIYADHPHFAPVVPKDEVRVGFAFPQDPKAARLLKTSAGIERWEADYTTGDHGFLGAPSGSKSTMDFIYLAPAMQKGLDVRAMSEVVSITRQKVHGKRFRVDYMDLVTKTRAAIECDHVFVGAGTMNTLRLLLESRDIHGGLSGMPDLGKRFSGNGDIRGFWDLNDQSRDYSEGIPSKGAIRLRDPNWPQVGIGRNNMPSINSYPFPAFIKNRFKRGMVVSGMGADAMDGTALIRNGKFAIDFDPSHSPIYGDIHRVMMQMAKLSGRPIYAGRRPSTVHPMGGACLGRTQAGGVIGSGGEVHGIEGLYVADGSAFPMPTAAPPTLSIGAWGENVAACFLNTK